MSTEGGVRDKDSTHRTRAALTRHHQPPEASIVPTAGPTASSLERHQHQYEPSSDSAGVMRQPYSVQGEGDKKPPARSSNEPSQVEATSSSETSGKSRQVIAVSASKGPAAFFNLARKFLVTDEICDLSALEGAIVSAVDAAHLLERSKLATIVRVQTSYVTVEPKRKKQRAQTEVVGSAAQGQQSLVASISSVPTGATVAAETSTFSPQAEHGVPPSGARKAGKGSGTGGRERELRRARIVITVRRTEEYRLWLEENPLQAIIAGDGDEDENVEPDGTTATAPSATAPSRKPPYANAASTHGEER